MALPKALQQVAEAIERHVDGGAGDPPYQLYVYRPADEFAVRRELGELRDWLAAREITCVSVSLADLFWAALAEHGPVDVVIQMERDAVGEPLALEEVNHSIAEVLRMAPTLPDRVAAALADCGPRTAAFLYRAGALYPVYRTSALLDDLRDRRLTVPVTLMYPGSVEGQFGLRFMDRREPAFGYRATIYQRGDER